jgi:hypothetical protein
MPTVSRSFKSFSELLPDLPLLSMLFLLSCLGQHNKQRSNLSTIRSDGGSERNWAIRSENPLPVSFCGKSETIKLSAPYEKRYEEKSK